MIAGVLGGLTGSIAGFASVATYPALLAVGLPPVAANVTNTVALVFNGIGSAWGSRPEIAGQERWLARSAPVAAAGGGVGAVLLLTTPPGAFEKLVPACWRWPRWRSSYRAAPATPGQPAAPVGGSRRDRSRSSESPCTAATSVRRPGVLLLALLLNAGAASLAHANAAKNVLLGLANTVAAGAVRVLRAGALDRR